MVQIKKFKPITSNGSLVQASNFSSSNVSEEIQNSEVFDLSDNIKTVGATAATAALGVTEGIMQFGELAIDALALTSAAVCTPITAIMDGVGYLLGTQDGMDNTEQLLNNARDFAKTEHVTTIFDDFYNNTEQGQWLANNAYEYEKVRQAGVFVGETGTAVAVSLLTLGAAGGAVGFGTATASGTINTLNAGFTAGVLTSAAENTFSSPFITKK